MGLEDIWDEEMGTKKEEEGKKEEEKVKEEEKKEVKEEEKKEEEAKEGEGEVVHAEEEKKDDITDFFAKDEPKEDDNAFDFREEEPEPKVCVTIYGLKGEGKTHLAFSFPGKIACLSFDHKSAMVKKIAYKNDKRIRVYDAIRYLDETTPEKWLESSHKTYMYVNSLLDYITDVDWIVIDGSEILQQICEMNMRYNNNLMPFQGIANRNLWKERRLYIRQIHKKAMQKAKKGVIYTTYTSIHEIIEEGDFIAKKEVPKWIDVILYETDVVIKVFAKSSDRGKEFWAEVESSKFSQPKREEITGKGIEALLPKEVIS